MQGVISEWRSMMGVVLQADENGLQGGTRERDKVTRRAFLRQPGFLRERAQDNGGHTCPLHRHNMLPESV